MDGELLGHPTADVPAWLRATTDTLDTSPWPDDLTPPNTLDTETIELIHQADREGYVAFMAKHPTRRGLKPVASIRVRDLPALLPGFFSQLTQDGYASVNTFRRPYQNPDGRLHYRTKEMLRGVGACFADLDFYKLASRPTFKEAYAALHVLVAQNVLPWPSVVGRSRGMYVLWLFQAPLEHKGVVKRLYETTQERIGEILAFLGADPHARDAARVLRAPGSYHTEADCRVHYVPSLNLNGRVLTYDLRELAFAVTVPALPEARPDPLPKVEGETARRLVKGVVVRTGKPLKPGTLRPKKLPPANSPERYVPHERLLDLAILAEARGGIMEGCRHFWLMRYAECLLQMGLPRGELYRRMLDINQRGCKPPQTAEEVHAACQVRQWQIEDDTLRQTRSDTIARELGVSANEARVMMRSIMPTEERQRRTEEQQAATKDRQNARIARKEGCLFLLRRTLHRCDKRGYRPGREALAAELAKEGFQYHPATVARWTRELGFRPNPRGRPRR